MAGLDLSDIAYTVATGCGASNVPGADRTVSEITCQGRAVHELESTARTVIDIGAQFSRVFRIDESGRVVDFVLSEQCAGGSGRLLQVLARVLQVDLTELGELSLKSTQKVDFTTSCAVFIESEIISRIAEGCAREDIAAGVQRSLASKVHVLAERVGFLPDFVLVGGTASNKGLVKSIETLFGIEIIIPTQPQLVAARGAALLAREAINTATDREN
jgi:predicted CoA-substrate-specific enzyme activase